MTCTNCGRVEVPLTSAVLSVDESTAVAHCVIRCPKCGCRMERLACDEMAIAMALVGATIIPLEEPSLSPSGAGDPPLSLEDVEEFRRRLDEASPEEFLPRR